MIDIPKKILIVEDEAPLRVVLRDNLEYEGFVVLEAGDGEEGLHLALDNEPDLILLDILMPRMGGIAMMEKLREQEKGKAIPIILLTNLSADQEIVSELIKNVPVFYFEKSGRSIEEIVQKVKAHFVA